MEPPIVSILITFKLKGNFPYFTITLYNNKHKTKKNSAIDCKCEIELK